MLVEKSHEFYIILHMTKSHAVMLPMPFDQIGTNLTHIQPETPKCPKTVFLAKPSGQGIGTM